jgi:DNA-directed RNA polymerase specialized sigma24 family protein
VSYGANFRLASYPAIARLPTRARQVFVLIDVEGYSHKDTALHEQE